MHNRKVLSLVLISFLWISGCKAPQFCTDNVNELLPRKYDNDADSASVKIGNWKEVFFNRNLIALIDSALKNNFDLRSALQKVEMARANLALNKGIRLPEVGVNASIGQRKFGDYTMDGVGNYDTQFSPNINDKQRIPNPLPDYYVGFQSSWEIDLWGKLKNRKQSAVARFIASQYGKDLIVTNLIAEVAGAYFELLALDNEVGILKENIALQQSALELVEAQKEAGKANELGVDMMKAQLLNSKAILAEVIQNILTIESRLNFLCGSYSNVIKRDTVYFTQHLQLSLSTGIPSDLISNRTDIRQSEYELKACNADVRAAQTAFYPSFNINAALGLQSFNSMLLLETPASVAYNVFGSLTAPLLNRRRLKADLMTSKAEQKQAYLNYERTIVNSFQEVYVVFNKIKNTKTMFELKREEVEILKKSITSSTELFKAGRANYLEVITSQKNTLQAQIELLDLFKRQNIALVDLYRAIGGGWR